jgi:leucyl-tRNA synthetase
MKEYNHLKIEPKWRKVWEKKGVNKTKDTTKGKKFYILDMFPYPSGSGLHVGHPRGYVATDVYSRYKKMHGFNVLHPMGWDSFGLPAENYAIKMKVNPKVMDKVNVKRYKDQISILGLNYDWTREINTTDPNYYKWTQWIFLQMFKKGLAFESYEPINWCPSCKTGLSNEDLEDGKCERCGTVVEKKPMRQWVLKITKYADRLIEDLKDLNWAENIKDAQRNWIGRSEGAELEFQIVNSDKKIKVFTTRADTLFGVTYVVLAPEAKLVQELKSQIKNWSEIEKYIVDSKAKTEIERTAVNKTKTGVELKGVFVINPTTSEKVPVWISDYVLADYGTGAVMAVPAHDERDYAFAKKYNLPIKEVISGGSIAEKAYTNEGVLINSGKFSGLNSDLAKGEITKAFGQEKISYKLKDWVFSRQRYWGEPIPLIHCGKCGVVAVPEKDLPVKLPDVKFYEPTGTGESPLAAITKWVNVKCPKCGGKGKRETNTMPQWAGSSWYYLRYIDPKNKKALVNKKKEKYWSPVDLYVGGGEHNTRHLIYARFWHKFLFDIGVVNRKEPFMKLMNLGMILGSDGRKMSKRWGNVVNPDDVVKNVGADTLRVYEMFMGPFDQEIAWSTDNMVGSRRFLDKVWRLQDNFPQSPLNLEGKVKSGFPPSLDKEGSGAVDFEILLNKTIKKVTEDILNFNFNTAISAFMILVNSAEKMPARIHSDEGGELTKKEYEIILKLLAPFAPHMTEEIWANLGNKKSIHLEKWPDYDEKKIVSEKIIIMVQINGKPRASFEMPVGSSQDEVEKVSFAREDVSKWLIGKEIKKKMFIKEKILSIITD